MKNKTIQTNISITPAVSVRLKFISKSMTEQLKICALWVAAVRVMPNWFPVCWKTNPGGSSELYRNRLPQRYILSEQLASALQAVKNGTLLPLNHLEWRSTIPPGADRSHW